MRFAIGDLLVSDDTIEAVFGWIAEQFVRGSQVLFSSKAESSQNLFHPVVGLLHSLADGLFLLRLEQSNGPDFRQIASQQIIHGLSMLIELSVKWCFGQQIERFDNLDIEQLQLFERFLFFAPFAP